MLEVRLLLGKHHQDSAFCIHIFEAGASDRSGWLAMGNLQFGFFGMNGSSSCFVRVVLKWASPSDQA
jgi:hypothetical protein